MGRFPLSPENEAEISFLGLCGDKRLTVPEPGVRPPVVKDGRIVVVMVCADMNDPFRGKGLKNKIHEKGRNEPAGMMTPLGPGIGKENVKNGDRFCRELGEQTKRIVLDKPDVEESECDCLSIDFS